MTGPCDCLLLRRFDFSRKAGEAGEQEAQETGDEHARDHGKERGKRHSFSFPSSLARPPLFAARETSGRQSLRLVAGTSLVVCADL